MILHRSKRGEPSAEEFRRRRKPETTRERNQRLRALRAVAAGKDGEDK